MDKKYREIDSGQPLRPGEFYVPASSMDFEDTRVYQADEDGLPKHVVTGELPSEVTFSRIQNPEAYIGRLKSSAERRLECIEGMTRGLPKAPQRDKSVQELEAEVRRTAP